MPLVTPFAQMPTTPEPIIAQVRRQLMDDVNETMRVQADVLDRVADRAVRELWGGRVKTFVPVLALRTAREMLRDQGLLIMAERPARLRIEGLPTTMSPLVERPGPDVLSIQGDVMARDDQDMLSQ